jgi:hypothetical protein
MVVVVELRLGKFDVACVVLECWEGCECRDEVALMKVVAGPKLGRCVVGWMLVEFWNAGEVALIAVVFGTKPGGVV